MDSPPCTVLLVQKQYYDLSQLQYLNGKVCIRARRPIRLALNSGFCGMMQLGILLCHPGWDANPGYPPPPPSIMIAGTHLGEERQCGIKLLVFKETTQRQRLGSNHRPPDCKPTALTTRPPRLHSMFEC